MSETELGWSDFSETEAHEWASVGVSEPDAAAWKALGVDVTVAKRWAAAGYDPREAAEWAAVIRPSHRFAAEWVERWRSAGFSSTEADSWRQLGLQPQEAASAREAGLTPQEAAEWAAVTRPSHRFALEWVERWRSAGFSSTEADSWCQHDLEPEEAASAREAGLTPQQAADEKTAQVEAAAAERSERKAAAKAKAKAAAAERAEVAAAERAVVERRMLAASLKAQSNPDLLFVEWSPANATENREFTTEGLRQFQTEAATNSWRIQSTVTSSRDVVGVLEVLAGYATVGLLDVNDFELNGVQLEIASSSSGSMLVPTSSVLGHELVEMAFSDASWLSGGPCVFEQSESLYRLADIYWSKAVGDQEQACAYAGRFGTESDGAAAAARVSKYYSVTAAGTIRCELDDWPNDE